VVVTAYAPTEMNPIFDSFAMYGLVNGGYEMPTHLEKTTYPPTQATTNESEAEDGENKNEDTEDSDSEFGEEITDPEEDTSTEFYD